MRQQNPATNRALWLSSFTSPLELVNLPIPDATAGSVVVEVLDSAIVPYADDIHKGHLPQLNLKLPLVPNPSSIGRVRAVGPDAVTLKPGDLVYFDPFVVSRDDKSVTIIQGHHGGEGDKGFKLMEGEWRDGSLQQYQKIPLENAILLDDDRLVKQLGYTPAELQEIPYYAMAVGALIEAAKLQASETVIIGPATGTFGGAACELALALGARVVALGRSKDKLDILRQQLGDHERFSTVVMTGDNKVDELAIRAATPGGHGADVFNDWTAGALKSPPFFAAGLAAVKTNGRVVLSGGASGTVEIPYVHIMHANITISGKWGTDPSGIKLTIKLVESDLIKLGRRGGAEHTVFSLDEHERAFQVAKEKGGFKQYYSIAPNLW